MTPFEIQKFQPQAWEILSRSFENKKTASTYLFHGPEGTGRWALAISLAALLNCEKTVKSDYLSACGVCINCRKIFKLAFEGLYFALPLAPHKNLEEAAEQTQEILTSKREEPFRRLYSEFATNISIDMVREIKRSLSLRGEPGTTRVVIFYNMEKMRDQSADALLKLIEEPPRDTVLIMISRRPEALLPTIQSRAQKIKLSRTSPAIGEKYLTEKHGVKEDQAKLLMRLSDHSVGRAIELIGDDQEEDSSRRVVGFLLFKSLFDEPAYSTVSHINDLLNTKDRAAADELINLWGGLIRDCLNYSILGDENCLINPDFARDIKRFSTRFPRGQASSQMTNEIKNTLEGLRRNVHIQGAVTALALKLKSHITAAGN